MTEDYGKHYSVMYKECLEALKDAATEKSANFADMTFGAGGHTTGLAKMLEHAHVYAVDQDPDAIKNGLQRLKNESLEDKVTLIKTNYSDFPKWVK